MASGDGTRAGSLAPLVASWNRWRQGAATFPGAPAGVNVPGARTVELYIGEQWVDITRLTRDQPGVYYRDDINITRGRPDESSQANPSTCQFTLNNRDGRFSPRNPMSPYYGKIARNTPVRVSVVQANGVRRYRFYGEVSSWPQRWDSTGTDVYVPVEAAGLLRRLGQGAALSGSSMYRGTTRHASNLVAYWPCEDIAGSTFLASAVSGVSPMSISGTPTLASDSTTFVSSDALPTMGSAKFVGSIPSAGYDTTAGQHQVRFVMAIPAGGATNGQVIAGISGNGTIVRWELYYGTGGTLGLRGFDSGDVNVADTGNIAFGVNGAALLVSLEIQQVGTGVSYTIATLALGAGFTLLSGGSASSQTFNRVTSVTMALNQGLTSTVIGQVTVQNFITNIFTLADSFNGYSLETAGRRIARLCAEEGINYQRLDPASTNTAALGVQTAETVVDLIREAVAVDLGQLYEPRDQVGLAYRDRESLYDQTPRLALSYSAGQLAGSLEPVDDDQRTRNDITVSRTGGSSVRATLASGAPLSVAQIGKYDDSLTLNIGADAQLNDQAFWRLHVGTIDQARYPTIQLNLAHPTFTNSEAMMSAAMTLDIGDRVTIDNLPSWLPPDQISLIVESLTERINGLEYEITINASPEAAYRIGIYDNTTWRYSSDGSTLTAAIGASDTSVSVTTATGPVWSVADGSFDIIVGGERMTVTGVSGAASPQTFTVTRAVNGIMKDQVAGATVALFQPAYYGI